MTATAPVDGDVAARATEVVARSMIARRSPAQIVDALEGAGLLLTGAAVSRLRADALYDAADAAVDPGCEEWLRARGRAEAQPPHPARRR